MRHVDEFFFPEERCGKKWYLETAFKRAGLAGYSIYWECRPDCPYAYCDGSLEVEYELISRRPVCRGIKSTSAQIV